MSSFVEEFKKYQKQERQLTVAIVLVSVLAPVSFTLLLDRKVHWLISAGVGTRRFSRSHGPAYRAQSCG